MLTMTLLINISFALLPAMARATTFYLSSGGDDSAAGTSPSTAWKTLDRFDRERPFAPWLRGIARNHVLAHYRKTRRLPIHCEETVIDHLDRRLPLHFCQHCRATRRVHAGFGAQP